MPAATRREGGEGRSHIGQSCAIHECTTQLRVSEADGMHFGRPYNPNHIPALVCQATCRVKLSQECGLLWLGATLRHRCRRTHTHVARTRMTKHQTAAQTTMREPPTRKHENSPTTYRKRNQRGTTLNSPEFKFPQLSVDRGRHRNVHQALHTSDWHRSCKAPRRSDSTQVERERQSATWRDEPHRGRAGWAVVDECRVQLVVRLG